MDFYVGTYSRAGSRGIYLASLDARSGAVAVREAFGAGENPSFLAIDRERGRLFAVSETGNYQDRPEGSVASFAIDPASGALQELSRQGSGGGAPAHLTVDRRGRFILVANYSGGNVAMLPVDAEGRLSAHTALIQHQGSSLHPQRQTRPHAHSITLDPSERYAIALDLGTDEARVYEIREDAFSLRPTNPPAYRLPAGSGPRHLAFHPQGHRVYVINELASSVTTMAYDEESGALHELQTVTTLPSNYSGQSTCADVHVSAEGDFVYGSNRGHDSIVVYAIDPDSGTLHPVQHISTGGRTPRNFALDPSGRFLIAANQDSNALVVFSVDAASGALAPTGETASVPAPVCVRFLDA